MKRTKLQKIIIHNITILKLNKTLIINKLHNKYLKLNRFLLQEKDHMMKKLVVQTKNKMNKDHNQAQMVKTYKHQIHIKHQKYMLHQ